MKKSEDEKRIQEVKGRFSGLSRFKAGVIKGMKLAIARFPVLCYPLMAVTASFLVLYHGIVQMLALVTVKKREFSKALACIMVFVLVLGSLKAIGIAEHNNPLAKVEEEASLELPGQEATDAAEQEETGTEEVSTESASPEQSDAETGQTEEVTTAAAAEEDTAASTEITEETAGREVVEAVTTEAATTEADTAKTTTEAEADKTEAQEASEEDLRIAHYSASQVSVDNSKSAEELAKSLVGAGINVTDASADGMVYSISNADSVLSIPGGVTLDTSSGTSVKDADLAALISKEGKTYSGHTSKLQFTMKATGKLLNFNYVFASAEFNQSSNFNDIFGLFVSVNGGPYENIALLDNGRNITITNLRAGRSGTQLANGASTSITEGTKYDYFKAGNTAFVSSNVNGVSNVFNAQKEVSIGDTVTVKFVIADVGDTGVDSFVTIERGSLNFAPDSRINYLDEVLDNLKAGRKYEITQAKEVSEGGIETPEQVYTVVADENGIIPFEGEDYNNPELKYNFIGKTISIVQKGENGEEDSEPQIVEVAPRPDTPDSPNVPEDVKNGKVPVNLKPGDVKTTSDSVIVINPAPGQEYSIDGGKTWKRADSNNEVVFANLESGTNISIVTRIFATTDYPKSFVSAPVDVVVKNMIHTVVQSYSGIYDGQPHGITVSYQTEGTGLTEGAKVTFCEQQDGVYTSEPLLFTDTGSHTVYYLIEMEDYYPAYGVAEVTIDKRTITVTPLPNQGKCIGTADGDILYTYAGEILSEPPAFSGKLSRKPGESEGAYAISRGSLALRDKEAFKAANYELQLAENIDYQISCHAVSKAVEENRSVPTCTQDGCYDEVVYCSECGNEVSRKSHVTPAAGHTFGEWEIIESPNCINSGSEKRICTTCGYIETLRLDPRGHEWEPEYTVDKEATCTSDGSMSIHCSQCSVCRDSEVIPRTGHTPVVDAAVAPACTKEGRAAGSHCAVCGEVLKIQLVLAATGHRWSDWKIVTEPTVGTKGQKQKDCLNGCGAKQFEDIPQLTAPGSIKKTVKIAPGAPELVMNNLETELAMAPGILSKEDKELMESGSDALVWLEVTPLKQEDVPAAEKAALEQKAKNVLGDGAGLYYFDISMYKQIGEGMPVQIYEPGIDISITMRLPKELLDGEAHMKDSYAVLRMHNGEAGFIESGALAEAETVSFETDRFSTYAVAYNDILEPTGIYVHDDIYVPIEEKEDKNSLDDVLKTGEQDRTVFWYWTMLFGGMGAFLARRRNKK